MPVDVVEGRYGIGCLVVDVTRPESRGQLAESNPIACEYSHSSLPGAAIFDISGKGIGDEAMPSLGLGKFKEACGLFSNCVYFLDQ